MHIHPEARIWDRGGYGNNKRAFIRRLILGYQNFATSNSVKNEATIDARGYEYN